MTGARLSSTLQLEMSWGWPWRLVCRWLAGCSSGHSSAQSILGSVPCSLSLGPYHTSPAQTCSNINWESHGRTSSTCWTTPRTRTRRRRSPSTRRSRSRGGRRRARRKVSGYLNRSSLRWASSIIAAWENSNLLAGGTAAARRPHLDKYLEHLRISLWFHWHCTFNSLTSLLFTLDQIKRDERLNLEMFGNNGLLQMK